MMGTSTARVFDDALEGQGVKGQGVRSFLLPNTRQKERPDPILACDPILA
jgi:hypothetical protein